MHFVIQFLHHTLETSRCNSCVIVMIIKYNCFVLLLLICGICKFHAFRGFKRGFSLAKLAGRPFFAKTRVKLVDNVVFRNVMKSVESKYGGKSKF